MVGIWPTAYRPIIYTNSKITQVLEEEYVSDPGNIFELDNQIS